ncbi:MAG: flagellar biosynthesis protein FlhA [Clostridiales bacterium]|nr:flagellar biosynthesis protein FlhA [Clostridiales bacterium]
MTKIFNNLVTLFVICILLLIIIPLNTVFLDFMLIFNLSLSLSILLITMYIKEPLEFSVFPSILLITTLLRVGLNVSSTRLILGHDGEAGKVIKTFGQFVIGGNPIVGFIIFIIIVVVQFIVITKGAERVAEVSARFTLDAMPGKQMAIDADLNSGLIDEKMAKQRRLKIQREADFYGSMDGASKFVKGDAIVSIIIVCINIIAGTIIGLVTGGKTITEVLSIYTIATVGDGLVSQIPALMISTATGMIVTRAASENSLSMDLSSQFFAFPTIFTITGCTLLLMCLIPGFPFGVLILFGGFLLFLGYKLKKRDKKPKEELIDDLPVSETEFYKNSENIYSLLNVEPVEMEFGYSLLPLVDEKKGGTFIDRVVMLRKQFAAEIGLVIPSVHLRDNMGLRPNEYVIKLKGEEIARGEVLVGHFLAMDPGGTYEDVEGIDTIEPAFGLKAKWVNANNREVAQMYGYTIIDALSVIITHLSELVKKHASELLGRKEVNSLLDHMKKTDKQLVEDIIPAMISIGDLQKVLANLLNELIPIKDITTILETLGEYGNTVKDTDLLTEYVRQALKRTITRKYAENGDLKVITVNPDLENIIMSNVKKNEHGSYITMEPEMMQKIVRAHLGEINKIKDIVRDPIVLTSPVVRLYYKKLIRQFASESIVLSFNEIEADIQVQSLGVIAV